MTDPLTTDTALRVLQAWELYYQLRRRAWLARLVKLLLPGARRQLLDLQALGRHRRPSGYAYAGRRSVSLRQIQGSEGRAAEFDAAFRPLRDHMAERWVRIALAYEQGMALPPVELIQVGDVYFVRDGHHRISVARAYGIQELEAEVLVYQLDGQGPAAAPASPPPSARPEQPAEPVPACSCPH